MNNLVGQTILHYKILDKLGEGGMGEVFKAQDTKLDRFVALKFLPSQMIASEDDKARFIQEAKAASSMNHPNVCTIYSIEEYEKQLFIAMEYVDGKTLKDKKGSLSEKQILEIGIQVAEGLAAAHEKGIVHRDIKPENIMIRKDGIAQIMDFGLAKLYEDKNVSRLTKIGTTMGTLGYMSPEQVQGLDVDFRTDIFSLGVLLYEMFAGEPPFKGVHETAIMYEIVNVEAAPLSNINKGIELELDGIILECLGKDRDERYQSAKELAKDLRKIKKSSGNKKSKIYNVNTHSFNTSTADKELTSSSGSIALEVFNKRFELRKFFPFLFILILVAAVGFAYLYFNKSEIPNGETIQFEMNAPARTSFAYDIPQISPDGKLIAFTVNDSTGKSMIWIRPLETINANPLEGTENAALPFWSYDGKYLGFFQYQKLQKINLSTGSIQTICNADQGYGAIWNRDNQIIFIPSFFSPLYKVNAEGGTPVQITKLNNSIGEEHHFPTQFFPDNNHFTFTAVSRNQGQSNIYIGSLNDNSKHSLFDKNQALSMNDKAFFISPDYMLYSKDKNLVLQKFDLKSYELIGDKRTILNNIQNFSASENIIIADEGNSYEKSNVVLYDRKGNVLKEINNLGLLVEMYPSPNEENIAYHRVFGPNDNFAANQDIWIYNRVRDYSTRLTSDAASDVAPIWSPDGKKIVYSSSPDSVYNIYEINLEQDNKPKLIFQNSDVNKAPLDWSSDGRYILVGVQTKDRGEDVWAIPMFGGKKPFPYLHSQFNESYCSFSPDGNWVAFSTDESTRWEVCIQSFPVPGKKYVVSTKGGYAPKWSKDGKELFYISADGYLTAVEIKLKNEPEVGNSKSLFKVKTSNFVNMYVVLNNGENFLFNEFKDSLNQKSVRIIANWKSLLNEK